MRTAALIISVVCLLAFGSNAQSLYGFNVGGILNVTNSADSAKSMIRMGALVEGFYMYQFNPNSSLNDVMVCITFHLALFKDLVLEEFHCKVVLQKRITGDVHA